MALRLTEVHIITKNYDVRMINIFCIFIYETHTLRECGFMRRIIYCLFVCSFMLSTIAMRNFSNIVEPVLHYAHVRGKLLNRLQKQRYMIYDDEWMRMFSFNISFHAVNNIFHSSLACGTLSSNEKM